MAELSGRKVLVTGASGLVAFPVAAALAKNNQVYALARWSDPHQKQLMEATGAQPITFDPANEDPKKRCILFLRPLNPEMVTEIAR